MITLTTPIQQPNATRLRVDGVLIFDTDDTLRVNVSLLGGVPARRKVFQLTITESEAEGLTVNAAPESWDDVVVKTRVEVTGAFSAVEAAFRAGGTRLAARKAVETALVAQGILAASLGGEVT